MSDLWQFTSARRVPSTDPSDTPGQRGRRVYYGTLADLITSREDAPARGAVTSATQSPDAPKLREAPGARSRFAATHSSDMPKRPAAKPRQKQHAGRDAALAHLTCNSF